MERLVSPLQGFGENRGNYYPAHCAGLTLSCLFGAKMLTFMDQPANFRGQCNAGVNAKIKSLQNQLIKFLLHSMFKIRH